VVAALCVGVLLCLGGLLAWALVDPLAPDCDFQRTAGNWQPECVQGR